MPELPEVETSVQAIQEFAGQNIESIKINNPNLRWKLDSLAFSKLKKQRVKTIYRRAKYILFKLEKNIVLIHLGMTGTLRIAENKLIFNDPRRFGSMHIISDPNKHFLLKELGVEPLSKEFNEEYLFHRIKKSLSPIKTALMNQKHVVGIGNIYASEILFDGR